jgi:hypothetical protein
MKKKIVIILLITWLFVFITDIICAYMINRPIFMILMNGGGIDPYWGLGYFINIYHSPPFPGESVYYSDPEIHPWLYLIANTLIIGWLIIKRRK